MSEEILHIIPSDIVNFLLVLSFSLLIGLEQRRLFIKERFEQLFGTDRTFVLIAILGYILYIINPQTQAPFLVGGIMVGIVLAIFYYQKTKLQKEFGITSLITALITYCLAPLIYTRPIWIAILIVVTVLIITELKETLFKFSEKFDNNEFITLAKFLILSGIILPLLPDKEISSTINISLFKFSLAVVAVSGISYFSYLLRKFVFPDSGIILTGILGGMYSSTATTFILARKSREMPENYKIAPAIILATSAMYVRLFILALFFNKTIAIQLGPSFAVFMVISVLIAVYFLKFHSKSQIQQVETKIVSTHTNPLELKTAIIFGALFILFAFITGAVIKRYGSGGINALSLVVGVTDIDPFILNLLQSKVLEKSVVVMAVLNAISSNNLLKMIYGITLCNKSIRWQLMIGFIILIAIGLCMSYFINW